MSEHKDHKDHPEHLHSDNQLTSKENVELIRAVLSGNKDEVLRWLKNGAKPNFFFRPEDQKNALHIASEHGFTDIMAALLDHGAHVNCISASTQGTPLIFAAGCDNVAGVRLLLNSGADMNQANGYGNTALHEACQAGLIENGRALLEAGAFINARNHQQSTPLHTLCYGKYESSHSVAFAKLLLDAGADVNALDKHGLTPLLVCCTSNRMDLINLLIEAGANPAVVNNEGQGGYEISQFYKSDAVVHKFNPVHDAPFSRKIFKM